MKNPVVVILFILVLSAAIFWGYSYLTPSQNTAPIQSNMPQSSGEAKASAEVETDTSVGGQPVEKKTDDDVIVSGRYLDYSKSALESAANTRRVLFFYADWCPTCRPADADFKANVRLFPKDLTLIKVNYNDEMTDAEEKDLAKKYGVTYQHTFVQIDSAGNEVTKWNGGKTAELFEKIK